MRIGFRKTKQLLACALGAAILGSCATSAGLPMASAESGKNGGNVYVNFAEALQLSMYFYDANRCGDGISGGWLEWRGDCHVEDAEIPLQPIDEETHYGTNLSADWIAKNGKYIDPDGDGLLELTGGWHDAGDHVKFGLPGAYAAATVGWGYYEFPEAFKESGQQEHIEDILRWINDYYMKVTYLDENGDLVAYCYQVGEGSIDHNYWNAPELQNNSLLDYARPAYFASSEAPAVDQCCDAAASLAIHYLNFKDKDPEYAQEALDKALALYKFAREHYEPDTVMGGEAGYDGGFYTSSSCYDEYAWAAVWLYICTEDYEYINQIISVSDEVMENGSQAYTGYMKRIIADTGNAWQNIWVHCWDTVWGGVFAKLAPITNTARDWYIFRWNLEFWSGIEHQYYGDVTKLWNKEYVPNNDTQPDAFLQTSTAGFPMLNNYGSCRYTAAASLCAVVYAKYAPDDDPQRFARWAKEQMIYMMGDNPMEYSYIVGYSDAYANHPHHRASHGSLTLNMDDPADQTHVLWGALVGGPDADDFHKDITSDYIYNEVAVDYNCGLVGTCAGLYQYFKDDDDVDSKLPRKDFPPKEEGIVEFYVSGKIEQENAERTQLSAQICGNTSLPPRYIDNYKIRYFFNLSEMLAAGQTVDDLDVQVFYDQNEASYGGPANVSRPVQWDTAGTYYVEIDWNGYPIFGRREIHFGLIPKYDANYTAHWDPTDDYSRQGLGKEYAKTEYICMYVGDELVSGTEPQKKTGTNPGEVTKKAEISAYSLQNSLDGAMADICATIKLANTGNESLDLSTAAVRYWFTLDSATDLQCSFDYAHLGEDNLNGKFVKLDKTAATADAYLEITFDEACGVLGASSDTGDIQFRILDGNYAAFKQAGDYSYNGEEEYALNPAITVYSNGKLIYGKEPVETADLPEDTLLGDVYIDGNVDLKDLVLLSKYVARLKTLDSAQLRNADCVADSEVNLKDMVILSKKIAKFDVVFGKQ